MTDEQKRFKAGQIVTARMRVFQSGPNDEGRVCLETLDGRDIADLDVADIVSVEPEPLTVGDMAVARGSSGSIWRIIAIHDNRAWLHDAYGNRFVRPLSDLVRA